MELEPRPPSTDDAGRIAALLADCTAADGVERPARDEIESWLVEGDDPTTVRRLWLEGDEAVAYSDLSLWNGTVWLYLEVRPSVRGGRETELLEWNVAAARDFGLRHATVRRTVPLADSLGLAATEGAGFTPTRHSYAMSIELSTKPSPAKVPDGVSLRRVRAGEERTVWAAHQEAFGDTLDHAHDEPYESWHEDRIAHSSFDPELWTIAEADDEIAGVALCRIRNGHGWVGVIGVRRPWRGRGLGAALLRESFGLFWDRGETVVSLSVDAESPTGAVRLYEREGMHVTSSSVTLERALVHS
jgi:GNAT superfamily N-acetyltransferase